MILYNSVYLTCSKKLTGSQLSLPHGMNKKLKWQTENKLMTVICTVQSHHHEGSPIGKRSLFEVERICWKGRFLACTERVKEWWMMRVGMVTKMGWQMHEEVSWNEWWGWRNESESWFQRRGDAYLNEWSVIFNEELVDGREWQQMRSGYCEGFEEREGCEDS